MVLVSLMYSSNGMVSSRLPASRTGSLEWPESMQVVHTYVPVVDVLRRTDPTL